MILFLLSFLILENICLKNTSLPGNVPFFSLLASVLSAQFKITLSLLFYPSCRAQHTLLQRHRERTSYISHSCPVVRRGAEASEPTPAGLQLSFKGFFNLTPFASRRLEPHLWGVLTTALEI